MHNTDRIQPLALRRSGPEAPAIPKVSARIDPAEVAKAKQQLAKVLGPIAGRIVDKAAARAKSSAELYGILGHHIDDPTERARFLAWPRRRQPNRCKRIRSMGRALKL
jgi:hypothetical protein